MTSSKLGLCLSLLLLIAEQAAAQHLQAFEAVEPHMGTLFRIKVYAASQGQATQAFQAAFARVAELDNILSDYKPDSELDQLSQRAVQQPVQVSEDLFRVLHASQKLAEESDGAFDVTIGPLSHLWRSARKNGEVPSPASVGEARGKCGYRKLHLDSVGRSVELDQAGMQLDVGAIAKGDAADQALAVLSRQGIKSALVAASGDLAFSDAPPGAKGWTIGLDSLDNAESPFTRVLVLANGAVSTSGSSEQHLDSAAVRYSHIIDPATGVGLTREITVSVVARRGIDADGFSTAVSVLGVKRGLAFIEEHPGASAMILTEQNGKRTIEESAGFRQLPTLP
ncbi:MAG TPA: FAD:protein FMN transferase [Bryobacteraceae bacterium]|nr:FAD:protein FMN transferase [Bryobacteraceae bacterium]